MNSNENVVAQTVTINSRVVGKTPRIIGLNSGNYISGANTSSFWRWTGVNGARIFTSAPNIKQSDDIPGTGDGVNTESSFLVRRAAVRAAPTDPNLINFSEFENGYKNNESKFINYDHAHGQFAANGIDQLAIINRTEGQFPLAANGTAEGWADRWDDVKNLLDTQGTATVIADNFVTDVGGTAEFLGHLTFSQDDESVAVEITDFLSEHLGEDLRLLIAREVRFDGEDVDPRTGAIRFDSKDNANGTTPRLILKVDAPEIRAVLGDFDLDGDVDLIDLDAYDGQISATAIGNLTAFDLDGDGTVGVNDFAQHYTNMVETSNGQPERFLAMQILTGSLTC